MKKYISLLLATAATIACTKVALEDNSPIESLPQEGNTENIQGEPSGEKIVISLAETKVSLDEKGYYQFDGDEVIYVQASSTKAVAKLQNSAAQPTTFTGEFNGLLGETSETFDFYYNCTDENANVVTDEKKVQNGQPWLAATVFDVQRSTSSKYSYELSGVLLKQLEGYVCLALNSYYECTVDFHTLTTALPNGETTISGIQLGSGSKKPYFVNIASGMTGGFYLAVTNPEGQKMYTSYGTGTTDGITSNQVIKTKKEFEAFSGVENLEISGFETTYSYYSDNNSSTDPNSKNYSWMNEGTVKFNLKGISSSLVNLTFNNGNDNVVTVKPVKSKNNNLFTYTFDSTEGYTTFGKKTLQATVSFKAGIESGKTETTTEDRYITGLPYRCDNFSNESTNWNTTSSEMKFKQEGIVFYTRSADGQHIATFKKNFFFPNSTKVSLAGTLFKGAYTWANITLQKDKQLVLSIGDIKLTSTSEGSATPSTTGFLNGNVSLKGSYNYNSLNTTYEARIGNIHILYN